MAVVQVPHGFCSHVSCTDSLLYSLCQRILAYFLSESRDRDSLWEWSIETVLLIFYVTKKKTHKKYCCTAKLTNTITGSHSCLQTVLDACFVWLLLYGSEAVWVIYTSTLHFLCSSKPGVLTCVMDEQTDVTLWAAVCWCLAKVCHLETAVLEQQKAKLCQLLKCRSSDFTGVGWLQPAVRKQLHPVVGLW